MDTSITLDTAKWNCDGAKLSSCVITLFYWIMYYNIRNTFGQIYQLTVILLFSVLVCLYTLDIGLQIYIIIILLSTYINIFSLQDRVKISIHNDLSGP